MGDAGETRNQGAALRRLQWRVASLTWLSYASYYLTRKHFAVVKGRLQTEFGISDMGLGLIDTGYLACYALGQFINGALGDRIGARRMIAGGMLASAAASWILGWGTTFVVFFLFFGINGLFQSTGWPNNVKAMAPWFSKRSRGRVMGVWCTNYQVGGIVSTALATFLLVHYGWQWSFRVPSVWVAGVGMVILLLLVERPQDRGLSPVESKDEADPEADAPKADSLGADDPGLDDPIPAKKAQTGFFAMIRKPVIWSLGLAYFGLKLIRYSLLFWLPFYLGKIGYDEGTAGYLSTSFEAGGIIGAILTGWVSDRLFPGKRARLLVPMLLMLAFALGLYRVVGTSGIVVNALSMGLVGFMLFGPDALISGAAAQDVGGGESAASAAGIINGVGSIGAILQGIVTATVSERWGWGALFYVFIGLALLSTVALLPMAIRERSRKSDGATVMWPSRTSVVALDAEDPVGPAGDPGLGGRRNAR